MEWNCVKCGECCQKVATQDSCLQAAYWKSADLTHNQQAELRALRQTYPLSQFGCQMLVFENLLAVCLIEKLYGPEKKPTKCRDFPFGHPEIFCFNHRNHIITEIYLDEQGQVRVKTNGESPTEIAIETA